MVWLSNLGVATVALGRLRLGLTATPTFATATVFAVRLAAAPVLTAGLAPLAASRQPRHVPSTQ